MPFTGSHPAAVLSLLRSPLPPSALVIGSIAPDLPFYLPGAQRARTHTARATVTLDVLIGGATWALWHGVLAGPALATAPAALRARLAGSTTPGLRRRVTSPGDAARVAVALAVGAASHVAWDEFTHEGRWGAEHVPALAGTWRGAPVVERAQDASGLLGAALLARWARAWWVRTPAAPAVPAPATRWAWPALGAAGALAGTAAALRQRDLRTAATAAVFRGGGAAGFAGTLLALGWHARRRG